MGIASQKIRGFTIVELLIVIVVIGILAAIVIVAFNGVQTRARNTARISEIKSWAKSFELYKTSNGSIPNVPDGSYCLGTGFPVGAGGVARCWVYQDTTYGFRESDNATLTTELKKVANVQSNSKTIVSNLIVGPMAIYSPTDVTIYAVLDGTNQDSDCPNGTRRQDFSNNAFTACYVTISKN